MKQKTAISDEDKEEEAVSQFVDLLIGMKEASKRRSC